MTKNKTDNTIYPSLINPVKLDQWLKKGKNVLFKGKHGVGKTSIATSTFIRNEYKWIYISGPTCDPYLDFVGLPRIVIENGAEKLKLITREDLSEANVIFIDEYNRSPKKIRNATMELIQFKSINGTKFPNLKAVWVAINPDDDDSYDVEPIDKAQLDRFHVHVEVPYQCDTRYFINKYGYDKGSSAINWWNTLDPDDKDLVSPRRLDEAIDFFLDGGDLSDMIYLDAATLSQLECKLLSEPIEEQIKNMYEEQNSDKAISTLASDSKYNEIIQCLSDNFYNDTDITAWILNHSPKEFISRSCSEWDESNHINNLISTALIENANKYESFTPFITTLTMANIDAQNYMVRNFKDKFYELIKSNQTLVNLVYGKVNNQAWIYSNNEGGHTDYAEYTQSLLSKGFKPNAKSRAELWANIMKYVPSHTDISYQDAISVLGIMEQMQLSLPVSSNFFLTYPKSVEILNTLLTTVHNSKACTYAQLSNVLFPGLFKDITKLQSKSKAYYDYFIFSAHSQIKFK